jgi:UDP-GlcNAc:undecaprenyl-phosphate GlcNAc-1-phosphate transferase
MVLVYALVWTFLLIPKFAGLFTDIPDQRRVHQRVTPRIGGLAVIIVFTSTLVLWQLFLKDQIPALPSALYKAFLFTAFGAFIIGISDDTIFFEIKNMGKLLIEIVIAIEIVFLLGLRLYDFYFCGYLVSSGWLAIPVSILWIVGVTNAVNIIDGIDGLAATIVFIAITTIALLCLYSGDWSVTILCVTIAGMISGFLAHNKSPARIFLGDMGSLFLGMILGLLSLYLVSAPYSTSPVLVAPLIVGLPILDVMLAMFRRYAKAVLRGIPWYKAFNYMLKPDNEHMHHRLLYSGLTHNKTTAILAIFQATICATAVCIAIIDSWHTLLFLVYLAFMVLWIAFRLDFLERVIQWFNLRRTGSSDNLLSPNAYRIAVIHSDKILFQSLKSFRTRQFIFDFYPTFESLFQRHSTYAYKIAIINIHPSDDFEGILFRGIENTRDLEVPLLFIYDDETQLNEYKYKIDKVHWNKISFITRPVYIPFLCEKIQELIESANKKEPLQIFKLDTEIQLSEPLRY